MASLVDTRAVVLIRAGQFDRAIGDLTKAQAMAPQNPNLAVHLAWAYQMASKRREAVEALERAERLGWIPESCDPLEQPLSAS